MLFRNITILDENFDVKENMFVGIKDDKIAYIGENAPKDDFGRAYEGSGKLLMPAFFDAHAHTSMTLMRGYGENMALSDWLNKLIFPFEDHLDSDSVYYGTKLCLAEGFRFGIVSNSDMYYFIDDIARAVKDTKCKGNISRAMVHFDDSDPKATYRYKEVEDTFKRLHNTENGRILVDASIHAEYTSNENLCEVMAAFAKEKNIIMHLHAAETESETRDCKARHGGLSPVQYFNKMGAFDTKALAAHCVWLDEEDYDILNEKNVVVASNPVSNMKLASGVCNVPKLLKKGVTVALGTDSVASNNSLNMFEEMKLFAIASKMMFRDPTAVTPKEAIIAATKNGAIAQGRYDTGVLKEGFKADLIVVDIDKPNMYPVHNLLNNLVYSASGSDIVLTMSDGEILYENGEYKTLDIEEVVFNTRRLTKEILKKL